MERKVQTQEMPEHHTSAHISERLLKASEIGDKIVAVVCDNAANMVLASHPDTEDLAMVKRFKEVVAGELLRHFPFDPESVPVLSAPLDP